MGPAVAGPGSAPLTLRPAASAVWTGPPPRSRKGSGRAGYIARSGVSTRQAAAITHWTPTPTCGSPPPDTGPAPSSGGSTHRSRRYDRGGPLRRMDRSGPRAAHPRPDDPTDRDAFRTYIDHTVATVLERNSTTDLLIELDRHPMPPPPELRVPRWLWNVPAVPVAALLRLTTAGYLPPVLRPRLGVEWSPARPPVRPAGARGRPTGSVAPGACPLSTVRSVHARRGLPAGCDPVLT